MLIGGKNVKELDYDTILSNVAIVFQKTFLTRDSVLENIRMGSSASLEQVRAAAKEARSTTSSCLCRMATIPRWGASAPGFQAERSSGSPLPAPF